MAERLTPEALRKAITDTLYPIKAYELGATCERLGLAPENPEGSHPFDSKTIYIRERLLPLDMPKLVAVGRKVVEEFGAPELEAILGSGGVRSPDGQIKNLIFAANGPKPRIVLRDAVENVIEIVENEEFCLVYDRPLGTDGLSWGQLVDWWAEQGGPNSCRPDDARSLFSRLRDSLSPDSPGERLVLQTYASRYGTDEGRAIPALIPQIYLHYDPYTQRDLGNRPGPLARQRMDFLLLMNNGARVVLEVDGAQHYSRNEKPSPSLYADMVSEDRSLRLSGYEVYRFGGAEFQNAAAGERMLGDFFDRLLVSHSA